MQNNDVILRADAIQAVRHAWAKGLEPSQYIENMPAVDAAPVVHGRWEFCGDDYLVCSVCGARYFKGWLIQSYCTGPGSDQMDGFWYCPHCGAKMDAPTCGPDYCEIGGGDDE